METPRRASRVGAQHQPPQPAKHTPPSSSPHRGAGRIRQSLSFSRRRSSSGAAPSELADEMGANRLSTGSTETPRQLFTRAEPDAPSRVSNSERAIGGERPADTVVSKVVRSLSFGRRKSHSHHSQQHSDCRGAQVGNRMV